jgi:hypothetical protein
MSGSVIAGMDTGGARKEKEVEVRIGGLAERGKSSGWTVSRGRSGTTVGPAARRA